MYQLFSSPKKLLLAVSLCFYALGSAAYAAGTTQNTSLSSALTIDYDVGSTNQSDVTDSQAFVVDRKVDVAVSTTDSAKTVTPGTTDQYVTYTVTNEGNGTQGYRLTLSHTDSSSVLANAPTIYVDDGDDTPEFGGGDTLYTSGSAVNISDLAADGSRKIFIRFNINTAGAGAGNGDTVSFILKAASTDAGTATETTANTGAANTAASVDTVHSDPAGTFAADAAYDGDHSATGGILVATATLTINKTMTVLYDNNPSAKTCATMATGTADVNSKAIPGACMHFQYEVANSGTTAADNVVFTIALPNDLRYEGALSAESTGASSCTTAYYAPTPGTPGNVTCEMGTIAAAASKTVMFRAIIQ